MTRPLLVVTAGPNGSGKSTLTDEGNLAQLGLPLPTNYINPDNIRREIVAERPGLDGGTADTQAFWLAREMRETYRNGGLSFAFETVLSHPSSLVTMDACRRQGYDVHLIYVTTGDVEINVHRVEGRVRAGRHYVDPSKIRKRYGLSHKYVVRAFEIAEYAWVFDTTGEGSRQLCIQKDEFLTAYDVPQYLRDALLRQIEDRKVDRARISMEFGGGSPSKIHDSATSEGELVAVTAHYYVQRTLEAGLIIHDRLQMDASSDENVGRMIERRVVITYGAGFGSLNMAGGGN